MGERYLQISIGYSGSGPSDPKLLEPVIGGMGDWLRYFANSWILATSIETESVAEALSAALHTNDHFMILEVNMLEMAYGRMAVWIWDWMNSRRAKVAFGGPLLAARTNAFLGPKS